MKRSLIAIALITLAAGAALAWDLSGNNKATLWSAQPGQRVSYKEYCDLRAAGSLPRNISIEAGLRYLVDQETWDDPAIVTGFAKRYLQLKTGPVTARAGTYYATLGRGLLLNCSSDAATKIDRDLEGAIAAGVLDGIGEARLLAGRVRENTVELDSTRTYAGGEVKFSMLHPVTLGAAYLRANAGGLGSDPSFGTPVAESYSGSAAGMLGPVEWYGEFAARHTYGRLFPGTGWAGINDVNGHGFYGSIAYAASGLGITVDGKRYRNLDAGINAPPPSNRDGRPLNNGADETGFQADVTVTPWQPLEIHGNGSAARSEIARPDVITAAGTSYSGAQRWLDLFGEARWQTSQVLVLSGEGRFRRENNLQSDIVAKRYKGATAGCVWTYRTGRTLSLKAGGNQYNNVYLAGGLDYTELLAELGWSPNHWLNVFASGDLADKRVVEYDDQRSWGELGCAIDLGGGSQRLQVSVGQTQGGLVCSGGFCRYEPAFRGMKMVWDWKF